MALPDPVYRSLRWTISIGAKFVRIVPGATALVVLATLVSQVAMLLAFFLPLKVVILLGSTRTPRYFPPQLLDMDRDTLVLALSVGAIGAYLLHLLAERAVRVGASYGARRLVERSRKLVLFEDQDRWAMRSYQLYSRALASGIFVALSILVLLLIYPSIAALVGVYTTVVAAILLAACRGGSGVRERLLEMLKPILATVSAVGFLLAFAWLVADFLLWTPPGLIPAIIAVLLVRQMFTRGTRMIQDITALYARRISLNALFFSKQVLLPDHGDLQRGIWPLLAREAREEWIGPALAEVLEAGARTVPLARTHWHQSGIGGVAEFAVTLAGDESRSCLLRLFDENRGALAMHEATLLAAMSNERFPTPPFLGATQVGRFHCHVFDLPGGGRIARAEARAAVQAVVDRLVAVEPPKALVKRYSRTHPYLWQRFDKNLFNRLGLAAEEPEQRDALQALEAEWEGIIANLRALPLVIINPDIGAHTVLNDDEGEAVASYWGRWRLEPVGTTWSVRPRALAHLDVALQGAAGVRRSIRNVLPSQARLAARVSYLEVLYARQLYVDALELIPAILKDVEESGYPPAAQQGGS